MPAWPATLRRAETVGVVRGTEGDDVTHKVPHQGKDGQEGGNKDEEDSEEATRCIGLK